MAKMSADKLRDFCLNVLRSSGVRPDVAGHVSEGLVQASLRGVDSHGVRLLPHYLRALEAGRLNPDPQYGYERTGAATGTLNADHTFGHAAGTEGMGHAIELARESGMGAVVVRNSSHFGTAAFFALMAARQDMIGLSFTHADALMLTYGGTRPFFGTNPICFAAPCRDEEPFCLDMATTSVTWNKALREFSEHGEIPPEWGVDEQGHGATSPEQMIALHPMGGYKGFGLGMMVEVLCGLLSGMPAGREITRMYADPIEEKRYLGHFFIAIEVGRFLPTDQFKASMQDLMNEARSEPVKDGESPVQVAGDPEKVASLERSESGIELSATELEEFTGLAKEHGLAFWNDAETSN